MRLWILALLHTLLELAAWVAAIAAVVAVAFVMAGDDRILAGVGIALCLLWLVTEKHTRLKENDK